MIASAAALHYNDCVALRLVEILLPADRAEEARAVLEHEAAASRWQESVADGTFLVRLVLDAEHTRSLVDRMSDRFVHDEHFRLLILPVAATVPRLPDPEQEQEDEQEQEPAPQRDELPLAGRRGISREELHHQIADMARYSWVYVAGVVLSSIVAAVGMMRGNVAAIIGAMVIAPLPGRMWRWRSARRSVSERCCSRRCGRMRSACRFHL